MKIWSPLLATALILTVSRVTIAQSFDSDFGMEITDDGNVVSDDLSGTTEVTDACNGFPQYRKLPINQAFYVGTNDVASGDILTMLYSGIRYLDIELCQEEGKALVCGSKERTFTNVLEDVFLFSRNKVEQFLVLNIKSKNVDTRNLEELIDESCKIHSEATVGTKEFKKQECEFVQVYVPGKDQWPSLGEVVNYNPEMAQWEGDGELVGVRTKFLITLDQEVPETVGYKSAYFSPTFWRSVPSAETLEDYKKNLNALCRVPAGGIGINANTSNEQLKTKLNDVHFLEELFTSRSGCNLNDSPLNTFISFLTLNKFKPEDRKAFENQFIYFKDLEKRMMDLNFEKWSGNYKPIAPLSNYFDQEKSDSQVVRDEL